MSQRVFLIMEENKSIIKIQKMHFFRMLLHSIRHIGPANIALIILSFVFVWCYVNFKAFINPESDTLFDWITGTAALFFLNGLFMTCIGRGRSFYILITGSKLLVISEIPGGPFLWEIKVMSG